ncbi:MAG TPA: penicillin-binding protein [Rhodospirillaceae bacterium]|nr:MAG: penicillin-binding protein [Alphaproteobacteria bacterium GWF2_58_20]HAU29177.1 penicillin-binding protein [Rhodospirillaceae bacterium]
MRVRDFFLSAMSWGLLCLILVLATGWFVLARFTRDIPDYRQLVGYQLPVVTRVHAGDGRLMVSFAKEDRAFVPISAIPPLVRQAFISAEDKNFYHHAGVDPTGILRAVATNLKHLGQARRLVGASTITQQVAKNFLLTSEVSVERKVKEAILAFRIEQALSKETILELYLNKIYLGAGSYGVAAAALDYFDKSLDELTIAEMAYLAGLPKAPNNYNPVRNHDAAVIRRNYVVDRMREDGAISTEAAEEAKVQPLGVKPRKGADTVEAGYFLEEVRRELMDAYGEYGLYSGGLSVRTTLDSRLQDVADTSLAWGLEEYDRRRGTWRGPVARLASLYDWQPALAQMVVPPGGERFALAVVLEVRADHASIGLVDGKTGNIPLEEAKWARRLNRDGTRGPVPSSMDDVLSPGDIVYVRAVEGKPEQFSLRQVPRVEGAIVALDPHTGRVLAMSGGWSYRVSQYNRAIQASRQTGSSFKPFVFLAALDAGLTPATLVLDAPLEMDQGPGLPMWAPKNYHDEYLGAVPLRVGLEKSRNLMTVRLAQYTGMEKIVDYAKRFGVVRNMPPHYAMALGAGESTALRMASAYAVFVNGGKQIVPTLIDRVQDRSGHTLYRHDQRPCPNCDDVSWGRQNAPEIPDMRAQIADPVSAYQIVSMLQGVVQRGTAASVGWKLKRPLAGKTGTTNDSRDAWFVGFSPDLVVATYIGYDAPESLGKQETGSSVAVPVFARFMEAALADTPATPFRVPPGVRMVKINHDTGELARPGDKTVIWEAFRSGTEPGADSPQGVLGEEGFMVPQKGHPTMRPDATTGTGGLY